MHRHGAGLLFCPAAIRPHTSVCSVFCSVHAIILQQRQNRLQGFTEAFPLICPIPAHTIQQTHKPPIHRLRHVGEHTAKRCTSTDTRYNRHAGRCAGQHSRPIIIRYIKGCAPVKDQCLPVQHSPDHASGGGSVHPACIRCRGQPGDDLAYSTQRRCSPAARAEGRPDSRRAARNH